MKVLGTAIVDCADDDRRRTVLVSDLHIPADGGFALLALEELCRRVLAEARQTRMLILGDLFDVWVTDAQAARPQWDRVVAALRRTVDGGATVTVIHGNRDFMLGRRFARTSGCVLHGGGLLAKLAGRSALLLHGDELCQRDHSYQRAKRMLRNPLTRGILRALPSALALRLAARARRVSADVQMRDRAGVVDDPRYEATLEAVESAFVASGCEILVHGHVHRPARTALGPGRELIVLPAFDEAGVHLIAEDDALRYHDGAGRPLPDFAARRPR